MYFKSYSVKIILIIFVFGILIFSCRDGKNSSDKTSNESVSNQLDKNYVEVTTNVMDFQLVDEVKSGWTTFKYINNSEEPHFIILEKMPDSVRIENYRNELIPPFVAAFTQFLEGNAEAGMKEFEKIPDWFYKVELGGGVGLTSPHTSTKSTIYLNPGVYVMECYVRMPNGMAHAFMGMTKELVVLDEKNDQKPPTPDFEVLLSSEKGITFIDSLKAGDYTLAVKFEDQKQYETFLGHDVNLVKLESMTLLDSLNEWINAGDIYAFRTPAPEGLTFLGGVEDLPADSTGYFYVSLEKGDYVLISEVPNAVERKMYKIFKVH